MILSFVALELLRGAWGVAVVAIVTNALTTDVALGAPHADAAAGL